MTEITFNLSEDLAKRAVRHFWLRQFGLQGFAIYGLCTILLLQFIVTDNINWLAWVFAIVVVGACILYPATYIFHLKRVKQELREFSSPTIVWNISDDGLISRSALGSSNLKWEAMKRLWCFPDMWLIFFSKYGEQFAILPTAALDEETAQFFFTKVKEHGGMISERRFQLAPFIGTAVQHAHAADRFAREIVAILALSYAARSRRLMRKTLGRTINVATE